MLLVLMIPAFSPSSILALPSMSLVLITLDSDITSWNDHQLFPLRTISLNLVLGTTPSNRRTSLPTSIGTALPRTSTTLLRMLLRSTCLATSLSPAPTASELLSLITRCPAMCCSSTSPPIMPRSMPSMTSATLIRASGSTRPIRCLIRYLHRSSQGQCPKPLQVGLIRSLYGQEEK